MASNHLHKQLEAVRTLLAEGNVLAARESCARLESEHSNRAEVHLLSSHIAQAQGDFDAMVSAALKARELATGDLRTGLRLAECLLLDGSVASALERGREAELLAGEDPQALASVGDFHTQSSQHEAAWRCYRKAVAKSPNNPRLIYNLASSAVATGRLDEALKLYERVIHLDPNDHDAWQNRSSLRRWTTDENHSDGLRYALTQLAPDHPGWAPLSYALAKELEDLEAFDESFAVLQGGAASRRRRLAYDIQEDEEVLAAIEATFDGEWFKGDDSPAGAPGPLFIVGLPRSGTTLVDRMLSSHGSVNSLGEINTLALAIIKRVGPHEGRRDFVERSANIDLKDLGEAYVSSTRQYGIDGTWLIDKTPLNSLYLGLIARALPGARIIHLRRHPMDSCYAMYKTLFRMGYPFSYSLQDVGRYVIAHHRLMNHWRRQLGDRLLEVNYEGLVSEPEPEIRRMLTYLDLPWDEACLAFQDHSGPAATASAAQVRQPLYRTSVGMWRNYEQQLRPLAGKLREQGLPVD